MRRKSERTASKKPKASPEKKVEKHKKTRSRRRKHSTSSENESADEPAPVVTEESVSIDDKQLPEAAATEASPEEAQDQVWHVKASEGSGELKKLKICLARPPSTPERVDRSPRSKRKHSRATSSSDTPSVEGTDEKKKSKHHHRKRATRDLKEELDKEDSHNEETEVSQGDTSNEISQSETTKSTEPVETPMSTTTEEVKTTDTQSSETVQETFENIEPQKDSSQEEKTSAADTTVASPKDEARLTLSPVQAVTESKQQVSQSDIPVQNDIDMVDEDRAEEKSEILELHAEESKCESDNEVTHSEAPKEDLTTPQEEKAAVETVSINEENINKETKEIDTNRNTHNNKTNVVESSDNHVKEREASKPAADSGDNTPDAIEDVSARQATEKQDIDLKQSDSVVSTNSVNEDVVANGQAAPIVRKRKWGTRSKLTAQKSITISTDILKDIIPDVKPVEFEEVIEEKKHKRERKVSERIERPVLPKIVIDNTENVEHNKDLEDKSREAKPRDLAANRKISIVKENESIIARPPSPPRNKQSCILYITNLVRPFTLPQLKNLLQRTGKIVENGFWIDRIKSKCFVQYDNEDQAVETRHALHGVTWPVSNPKTLQVDFSTEEAFEKAKSNEEADTAPVSTIPGTVEDWLREQDLKRERGEVDKPWERKTREWDLGKNEKDKDKDVKGRRDERGGLDKRRHRSPEKSPEPARKFKKKEEEAPAKLLDDLFRKTKITPCIYWLPLSAETIAIKEEQRRQHMAEHERRLQELRRTHRRH